MQKKVVTSLFNSSKNPFAVSARNTITAFNVNLIYDTK